jgi:hypothetical protein
VNRHAALGTFNGGINVEGSRAAEWFRCTKPNKLFDRSGISSPLIENLNDFAGVSRPVNRGVRLPPCRTRHGLIMNERRKKRAEKILAGGRKRYVLVQGGLVWGLFVATGTAGWKALDNSGYSLTEIDWARFLFDWLIGIPIYFVAGCLFGLLMWEFFAGPREEAEKENQK